VEIGGSFRVHEIMTKSGARLREVGATNRTHVGDYVRAIGPETGALLKVHRSNFAVEGFTAEVMVRELVPMARERDLPILHDLGSGLLMPLDDLGLRGEPTASDALAAGASVVMMSGDKLLGGPQAGLILGEARYIAAMRSNPLARSYRVDKMTLAALEATLALSRDPVTARREIPILAMLAATVDELRTRAGRCVGVLREAGVPCEIVDSVASVGAGAFPTAELPSVAIALGGDADAWSAALRGAVHPMIGRIRDGHLLLDLRTVPETLLPELASGVIAAHG
jgi:L-seryl-tRNA(Ser) seleniumtransferase